jgi:type IX secretion system PorP/SprF family membrane protein
MNLKVLSVLILLPVIGFCQYNPTNLQFLRNPEFINPGYHSFFDQASAKMLSSGFSTNGTYEGVGLATNLNLPITKWHIGLGMNTLFESIDIIDRMNFDFITYVDVKISKTFFLSFGISEGTQTIQYNINDNYLLKNYYDTIRYKSSNNFHAGTGINLFIPRFHLGISLHYQQANENSLKRKDLFTLYLNSSYRIKLNEDLELKPIILCAIQKKANIDYGIFLLYKDKGEIGLIHRLNETISLFGEIKIFQFLRMGYGYNVYLKEKVRLYGSHEFSMQVLLPKMEIRNGELIINN